MKDSDARELDEMAARLAPFSAYEGDPDLAREVVAAQAPSPRTSTFYSAARLKGRPVPERPWLVQDLIPDRTVTLFSGDGGTGKSLLALQLAIGVAAEAGWLGMPVKPGRVICFSAEDDEDELHRRVDDILRQVARTYDDLEGLTLRSLAGEDALLAVESEIALVQSELFSELEQRAADEAPALILIDTAADVYPANENDRAKVRQFIGLLRGLAIRQHCAVVLLAHPSLTGLATGSGLSGSTAWNNPVRSRLYLLRIVKEGQEPDSNRRLMRTMKATYAATDGEISMTWREGVFVADAALTGLDRLAANAKAERVFLSLLDEFTAQGRHVNSNGGTNYAPKVFAEHPRAEGVTNRAFRSAMETLLEARRLTVDVVGPPSRRVSFIVRASQ